MSAKQETFKILDHYRPGDRFSGTQLMTQVQRRTGETHYPSSMLRYMREYRRTTGREIRNIDKRRSIYEVLG